MAPKRHRRADVVVVGAGLAGLTAARTIAAAGRSVIVLEARHRVGGRTLNHRLGGGRVVEVGGQWIGPTQSHLAALASELGVETYQTYNDGNYLFYQYGHRTPYTPRGPLGAIPPDYLAALELETALLKLDAMARTVPLEAPWTAPDALAWDSQTFETWKLANTLTPGARALLDLAIEAVWACEPRDVSLLHVLFYIHSADDERTPGTLERLINTGGGAQESRFVGGSQLISIRAAAQLDKGVILSQPVRRIAQDGRAVTAYTDGLVVSARAVIVTGPPSLTGPIRYEPDLPPGSGAALAALPSGLGDQGRGRLPDAVLARPRPRRPGHERHRTDPDHVRQLTPGGNPRRPARLRRGSRRAGLRRLGRRRAQGGGDRVLGALFRLRSGQSERLVRDELVGRAVDAGLLRRLPPARGADGLRGGDQAAIRADPLGGSGDFGLLERLHGRRRAVG